MIKERGKLFFGACATRGKIKRGSESVVLFVKTILFMFALGSSHVISLPASLYISLSLFFCPFREYFYVPSTFFLKARESTKRTQNNVVQFVPAPSLNNKRCLSKTKLKPKQKYVFFFFFTLVPILSGSLARELCAAVGLIERKEKKKNSRILK